MAVALLAAAGCSEQLVRSSSRWSPSTPSAARPAKPSSSSRTRPSRPSNSTTVHQRAPHILARRRGQSPPDRITLFATKLRIYADDGAPLQIIRYREMHPETNTLDRQALKDAPPGAVGTWLLTAIRNITKGSARGPVIVLFYNVEGTTASSR